MSATIFTWTGGTSGTGTEWNIGTNWAGGVVPISTSDAVIQGTSVYTVNITSTDASNLTINDTSATVEVAGTATFASGITLDAGTITTPSNLDGPFQIFGSIDNAGGVILVPAATSSPAFPILDLADVTNAAAAQIIVGAGSVLSLDQTNTNLGTIAINGGDLAIEANGTAAASLANSGLIQLANDGTLDDSGAASGTPGTITANGTLSGIIRFLDGTGSTLLLGDNGGTSFTQTIDNFQAGDTIVVGGLGTNLTYVSGERAAYANGTLGIYVGTAEVTSFLMTGITSGATFDVTAGSGNALDITTSSNGSIMTLSGPENGYAVDYNGSQITVADPVAGHDGVQTRTATSFAEFTMQFSNGTGLADPTGNAGAVGRLYEAVLGRAPDLGGLEYWTNALNSGALTLQQVATSFVNSPEFLTNFGTDTAQQFVTAFYSTLLGRTPDSSGNAYWLQQLNISNGGTIGSVLPGNASTIASVVLGFTQSFEAEYDYASPNSPLTNHYLFDAPVLSEVDQLYSAAFGPYPPDESGFGYWVGALQQGMTQQQIAGGFVASNEFQQDLTSFVTNTLGGSATNITADEFVRYLYHETLGRSPDASGEAYWDNSLGGTNAIPSVSQEAGVLVDFATSPENINKASPQTHNGWVFIPSPVV